MLQLAKTWTDAFSPNRTVQHVTQHNRLLFHVNFLCKGYFSELLRERAVKDMLLNFFLWDYEKSQVYENKPRTIRGFQQNTTRTIANLLSVMCESVNKY